MDNKGLFVVVEGADGTGKSTLVQGLASKLEQMGLVTYLTKETTAGPVGCLIRNNSFSGLLLAELQAADRVWHIENEVEPALQEGKIVISDRFFPSSFVYQQIDGLDLSTIEALNQCSLKPDISIFLFADAEQVGSRLKKRKDIDRFEELNARIKVDGLYRKAVSYCIEHGYRNVLSLDNNTLDDLETNLFKIISLVKEVEGMT